MRWSLVSLLAIASIGAIAAPTVSAQTAPVSPTAAPAEAPAPPPQMPTSATAPAVTPASAETPAAPPTLPPATPTPAPPSPTPVPRVAAPRRLADTPVITVSRLSQDNPLGLSVDEPAALPPKPPYPESSVPVPLFAAIRVDAAGKVLQSKIVRDPIPSLSAESRRSFEQRWSFDPAIKGGQPVETWASVRVDLQVEVRPREEQATLTPVTPATALPVPFEWGDDAKWYESLKARPPTDGTLPLEQVDTTPNPKKTKWTADSYKGPFSCRFWVKVNAAGRIEKTIPIQASDPVLISYMRRTISSWPVKPGRVKGQPVDSWNELSISGQLSYSIDVKQINNLRKTLAGP